MQSTHSVSDATLPRQTKRPFNPTGLTVDRNYAIEEINAYITIRDGLLAEAEKGASCETLRRVAIANDFVETCLKPARPPYEAQHLAEIDAVRERRRCEAAKLRIAQLSSQGNARIA